MFVREKKNKSGSVSIQILSKENGRNKLIKTIGCATERPEIESLKLKAQETLDELLCHSSLLPAEEDQQLVDAIATLNNQNIQTIGPELIFGRIYDAIGFNQIKDEPFRHLVIARLAFPLSKLKTIDYLRRYQGVELKIDAVYRFLDRLEHKHKALIEQIAFKHTLRMHGGVISAVFYDMTTLHFETEDDDDLRRTGFSKVGKHRHPQIYLGLLVGANGYPLGYDIFEGKTYEGHTLIPFLEAMCSKFQIDKPIVVADSGLLSRQNLEALETRGYEYILGARLKVETAKIKNKVLKFSWEDGDVRSFIKEGKQRLAVHFSKSRAHRDAENRRKGLEQLKQRVLTGRLTKQSLNNRGYNKYLKLHGEVSIEIDMDKYEQDGAWDGLKGYITNTKLSDEQLLAHYGQLWQIEKAFRMSKTDLRIRPIYHRLESRIRAHICIVFTAYTIYKTLETALMKEQSTLSLEKAAEATQTMYQVVLELPSSKRVQKILLGMDEKQRELLTICEKHFRVTQR